MKLNGRNVPDHADIIIFGPTGSGKSSLIRTFYRALHDTQFLPESVAESLCIKGKVENEGTTQFTAVTVKKRNRIKAQQSHSGNDSKSNSNRLGSRDTQNMGVVGVRRYETTTNDQQTPNPQNTIDELLENDNSLKNKKD